MFKIKSYHFGFEPIDIAPWKTSNTTIFYSGVLSDNTSFVAKTASAGWGDSVSGGYIEVEGEEIPISDRELFALLTNAEQVVSPMERKMAETVGNVPFWTIFSGPRCGEERWELVCPHGYQDGEKCPMCEKIPYGTKSEVFAMFSEKQGIESFRVYSLPEAHEIMYLNHFRCMNKQYPGWGGYSTDTPWDYDPRSRMAVQELQALCKV